jgi:hypothetical protein
MKINGEVQIRFEIITDAIRFICDMDEDEVMYFDKYVEAKVKIDKIIETANDFFEDCEFYDSEMLFDGTLCDWCYTDKDEVCAVLNMWRCF